jgi:hypothetical protein
MVTPGNPFKKSKKEVGQLFENGHFKNVQNRKPGGKIFWGKSVVTRMK